MYGVVENVPMPENFPVLIVLSIMFLSIFHGIEGTLDLIMAVESTASAVERLLLL